MFASALGDLSSRVKSDFLISYLTPAMVAVFGAGAIAISHLGVDAVIAWMQRLDTMQEGIVVLLAAIGTLMLAFLLQALSLPILDLFVGQTIPERLAAPMLRRQLDARRRSADHLADPAPSQSARRHRELAHRASYPRDDACVAPTRLGNVINAAVERPSRIFGMDGQFWLPRLLPLLPPDMRSLIGETFAPVASFLNLTLILPVLGVVGAVTFGVLDGRWALAAATLAAGLLLSRWCYRAAVLQATQFGELLRVAFDLYRTAIIERLGIPVPGDADEERALWENLDRRFAASTPMAGTAGTASPDA